MSGIIWRIIIAIVGVWAFNLLFEPVMRLIGLGPLGSDAALVVRVCVGLLALGYILFGKWPTGPAVTP